MHKHIICNHDLGLFIVIYSNSPEIDLVEAMDEMIKRQLCHA